MNKFAVRMWLKSLGISAFFFILYSVYIFLRRGEFNLFILNKVFSSSAVIIAGFTLVIRSLTHKFRFFSHFMVLRRELGLIAFGFAIAHLVISLLQIEEYPFPGWYLEEIIPILAGLLAILLWSYMAYISNDEKIKKLGPLWHTRLSIFGQIGFVAIFLHVIILKYNSWIIYLQGQGIISNKAVFPRLIPESFLIFLLMIVVITVLIKNYREQKLRYEKKTK